MKKLFVFILLASFLTACVTTAPVKLGKPIEIKGASYFSRQYQQEGKNLDITDMFQKLGENPSSKEKVTKAKYKFYGSMVLAGIGGYLVGYNLVSTSSNRSSEMMTGVLVAGAGIGLGYFAAKDLDEAINSYNQNLGAAKKKTGMRYQLIPYALNDRAGLGLNLTF